MFAGAAVLVAASALLALYLCYFRDDGVSIDRGRAGAPAAVTEPLTRKLLIVVSDSVRREPMEDEALVPFFHEVGRRGITGCLTVPGPTLTGISVTSFGTGVTPPLKTAMTNFVVPPWPDEDVFDLAARLDLKTGFFGDGTWFEAFDCGSRWRDVYPFTGFHADFEGYWYRRDLAVIDSVESVLAGDDWNLLVVHFSTTDKLAHRYGAALRRPDGGRTPYASAIHEIDAITRRWMELAGDDATLFILSDHGCTRSGTHGSFERITRETLFAAAGPGVRRVDGRVDLDATELAALWTGLFGLRAPRCAEAPLRAELLTHAPEAGAILHVANLEARLGYARALADRRGWDLSTARYAAAGQRARRLRREEPEAAGALAVSEIGALNRELDSRLAEERARHRGWAVAVLGLLIAVLAFSFGAPASISRRLAGTAALILLVPTLEYARSWSYWVMGSAEYLAGVSPWLSGGLALALGAGWSQVEGRTRRYAPLGRYTIAALFVLATYMIVAWPYGPKPATFLGVLLVALGAVAGARRRDGAGRGHLALLIAPAAAAIGLFAAARVLLTGEIETLYRVPESTFLAVVGALTFAALAAWISSTARLEPSSRGPGMAVRAAAAVTFAAAWAAHATGSIVWGWSALAIYLAGLSVLVLGLDPRQRPAPLILLHVALYRALVTDANLIFGVVLAAAAWAMALGLRRRGRPADLTVLATFLLLEIFYWFVQGYQYKLSTFDMNTAFVLAAGDVDMALSALAIGLQQLCPLGIVLAACAAADDDPSGRTALLAPVAFLGCARIVLAFVVLRLFEEEGWYFLRSAHYQFFEGIKLVLALLALAPLVLLARKGYNPQSQ